MPNTILHKRNSTPGAVPPATGLSQGELGINIGDGKLYTKNSSNNIINLGTTSISGTYITPSSGNFSNYLAVNGVPVSVSGHSHTTIQQAESLVTNVFNETGSQLSKMTAVYINGGHGDLPTVQKAIATSDATSAGTYGLTYTAINNMESGQVIVFGSLSGLNTDPAHGGIAGATEGSVLYLSPTVSGALTTTKPYAPNHVVTIGTVVRVHQNEGVVEVRIQNGFELDELHNVAITGATNGQFLQYNSGSGLWIPSSSGNFSSLSVNNTGVSLNGHNHNGIYADIATGDPTAITNSIVDNAYAMYDPANDWPGLWVNDSNILASDPSIFNSFKINMGLTEAVIGTGIVNHIPYWNSINGIVADSGQLVWDSANNRLGIGTTSPTNAIHIDGFNASNSQLRVGSLEFQPYSLNNAWIGENVYYNGSNFKRRQAGSAGLFYFQGSEGQFRFDDSNDAETSITSDPVWKIMSDGSMGVGSGMDPSTGSLTNSKFKITSNGGMVVGEEIGGYVTGGTHKIQSVCPDNVSMSPLTLIGGNAGIEMYKDSVASAACFFGMSVPGNAATDDFSISMYSGSWGEKFKILNSNGNVGIGIQVPIYKLDINGNVGDSTNGYISIQDLTITNTTVGTIGIDAATNNLSISGDGTITIASNVDQQVDINANVDIGGDLTFNSYTEKVVSNGNSGTSKTLSLASGTVHTCTLTGNCTFTMPTATAGKSFTLFLSTGAGSFTGTFTGVRWAGGTAPTITTTASKVDILSFISDGSFWYGSYSQNYG